MANPTVAINVPARVETTGTTVVTIPLNPDRFYEMIHRGVNTAGAAAVGNVFFGVNGFVPTATFASGEERGTLVSGDPPIAIGPKVSSIKFITAADSPVIDIFPSGTVSK